jgi:small subunit ribosomal protein S12
MSTLAQLTRPAGRREKKPCLSRTPRLRACPHGRGLVVRVIVMNPKKPNSAIRHVAKVKQYSRARVTARIPGSGLGVNRFNRVLLRGGRANDLPGVGYSLVRGVYDFSPRYGKKRCRSFYAVPRPEGAGQRARRRVRRRAALGRA